MFPFVVEHPNDVRVKQNCIIVENIVNLELQLSFIESRKINDNEFFFGVKLDEVTKHVGFIMTHEQSLTEYKLPFAFPAMIEQANSNEFYSFLLVSNYYDLNHHFRNCYRVLNKGLLKSGLTNKAFSVKKNEVITINISYKISKDLDIKLNDLIKESAHLVLGYSKPYINDNSSYSANVKSYKDAAFGLTSNLTDERAIVNDGIGTFIPYCYLEEEPYSESFVLMGVAKGLYPYSVLLNRKPIESFILKELLKITNQKLEFPWITEAHGTEGFFHYAWGSLPVGVDESFIFTENLGKFSDIDGHEEGANLLSTWKYFSRVEILAEMALLDNNKELKAAFLKTLPFVSLLKNNDYSQPVSYDLDSHKPATGNLNGGSAGGAAFWAMIHFSAYDLTKNSKHLKDAIKALNHANTLDFDHYYGMRVAPKPTTVGWLTKANIYAYELTGESIYLESAKNVANSIYFFYYLLSNPYTYFSTIGFGYACARERWEAFLEMTESLYCLSFYMKYNKDPDLFKLFWYARENILWALPLNGNPYGNLERPYDSIGGEYVPYEFSTGHFGDSPGKDGGSQTSMRQVKEIYGSGEVYLAYMMFELNAYTSQKSIIIIKSSKVNHLTEDILTFSSHNVSEVDQDAIIVFDNLKHNVYDMYVDNKYFKTLSKESLKLGVKLNYHSHDSRLIILKPSKTTIVETSSSLIKGNVEFVGFENILLKWESVEKQNLSHYHILIKNHYQMFEYTALVPEISVYLNREEAYTVEISAILLNDKLIIYSPYVLQAIKLDSIYNLMEQKMIALNCDHQYDSHMHMFYGKERLSNIQVQINTMNYIIKPNSILEVLVASLNDGCEWSLEIHTDKQVYRYKYGHSTGLKEIDLNELIGLQINGIYLHVKSAKAIGFSLQQLRIIQLTDEIIDITNTLPLKKQNGSKYFYEIDIPYNSFKYVEILVNNISQKNPVSFDVNDESVYTDIEKKYPNKVNRSRNGVYKFNIDNFKLDRLIISAAFDFDIEAIRFTNLNHYPRYSDYMYLKDLSNGNTLR